MSIKGTPDPQERLVGREVEIDFGYKSIKEKDVERMAFACLLMKMATRDDYIYETDIYVNARN